MTDMKLDLASLAPLAPRRGVAHFLRRHLDPAFLAACIDRQAGVAAQRAAARKRGEPTKIAAPLAGVLIGTKQQYPALYDAFFHVVKAGVMAKNQLAAIQNGMPFAGVKNGDRVEVTDRDFIDPLTVFTHEGTDVDLRSEGALLRLTRARMELDRVHNAETVLSKGEAGALEAAQFAHSEYQLLSDALLDDVQRTEGLVIPWDATPRDARALAETITDPYLRGRVMTALDAADGVDDRDRVYLHAEGQAAFRVRKTAPAEKWTPYTPTPTMPERPAPAPARRRAGTTATVTRRVVSRAAHTSMLARLDQLRQDREHVATLMGSAIEDGDLRESAAYDEARSRMFQVEADINRLETELAEVEAGDVESNIGRTFVIEVAGQQKTVRLTDGQPSIGEVSVAAPLGKALLTAQEGQTVTVTSTRTHLVPTTAKAVTVSGTTTKKRSVPKGMTAPILPDVTTTYTSGPVTYRREQPTRVETALRILSIT